jgi:hypothetical protein
MIQANTRALVWVRCGLVMNEWLEIRRVDSIRYWILDSIWRRQSTQVRNPSKNPLDDVINRCVSCALGHSPFRTLLGDTDTKEEIINSFRLINRADHVVQERLDIVSVPPHVQQYIRDTAPAVDGGWNYHAWTEDVFSR